MQPISRAKEGLIEVFDADLELVLSMPITEPFIEYAVPPSLDRVAYLTRTDVVCLAADGHELWRFSLGRPGPRSGNFRPGAAYSFDGGLLWVFAPDAVADRGDSDRWVALDAATGMPRFDHRLGTAGPGGEALAVPGSDQMLLEVAEADSGSIFRAAEGELHRYPFTDRALVAVSPDGSQFMTVGHDQEHVTFHAYPGAEVLTRVAVDRIVVDTAETFIDWSGGYLDTGTAVVVVGGEDENEQEWWTHYRIDVHTGEVLGPLWVETIDSYDLRPMGDGSFVVTDSDGTMRRLH